MVEEAVKDKNRRPGIVEWVERAGNKLPHPFMLFCYFIVLTFLLSWLLSLFDISVTYVASSATGAAKEVTVAIQNLFAKEVIQNLLANLIKIYSSFPPLGVVMVFMVAMGLLQNSGFFDALIRKLLLGASPSSITFVLALIGICANLAGNAGIVLSTTIGAALFSSIGRSPLLGATVGYVSAHGGFAANLMVTPSDALLTSITQAASDAVGIEFPISPLMNWFFLASATLLIAGTVTLVTEKIVAPHVPAKKMIAVDDLSQFANTPEEKRGLRWALFLTIAFTLVMLALMLPSHGWMRNAQGKLLPVSPFTQGISGILFAFFILLALAHGLGAGTIRNVRSVVTYMASGLQDSLSYFVVILPAAIFIHLFKTSNLATVLSVEGARLLQRFSFTGFPLVLSFIILSAFLNLFLTSGSSKWLILAPIFVPMMAVTGLSPALVQLAYRIGDTVTNPITPVNYFLPIVLTIVAKYYSKEEVDKMGLGNVLSLTFPYSIAFLIILLAQLGLWMLLGWPVGPGASQTLTQTFSLG